MKLVKDKEKIRHNFDMASDTYENFASVQYQSAEKLCKKLLCHFPELNPYNILDLGTGTGFITKLLYRVFPTSRYTLNDISLAMLGKAKEKFHNNVKFVCGDMEMLDFGFHDLVVSNLALQWVNNLNKMLEKVCKNLKIFAFTCLLKGSFQKLSDIFQDLSLTPPIYQYPSQEELEGFITSIGVKKFMFDVEEIPIEFSSALDLFKYFKYTGANTPNHEHSISNILKVVRYHNYRIRMDYKVFFGFIESK